MRPVPIPDELIWPGSRRLVLSAPNGDLLDDTIRPVEALFDADPDLAVPRFSLLIELDTGDLEKLKAGARFWLVVMGDALPPIGLELVDPIVDPREPETPPEDELELAAREAVAAHDDIVTAQGSPKREQAFRLRDAMAKLRTVLELRS